jgi:hemoglobin
MPWRAEVSGSRDILAACNPQGKDSMVTFSMQPWRVAALLLGAASLLSACVAAVPESPTLYQRLGGVEQVPRWIGRLIDRSATDPRTRRSFEGVKLAALKESLAQQVCSIAGGGCRYEGETMERAHRDAKIGAAEFDALVSLLREELDRAGVDPAAKNELLRLFAPMKRDIVTGAGAAESKS